MTADAAAPGAAMALARALVAQHGSIQAAAAAIGRSRPALSMYLSGTYPAASVAGIEAAILAAAPVACPHLGATIPRPDCRAMATRAMPLSDPRALRHWQACRDCPRRLSEED